MGALWKCFYFTNIFMWNRVKMCSVDLLTGQMIVRYTNTYDAVTEYIWVMTTG